MKIEHMGYGVRCRAVFLLPAVALVGGNCNNGVNCGADYVNLNNSAGNANWNIGASNFFSYRCVSSNAAHIPHHTVKIIPDIGSVE